DYRRATFSRDLAAKAKVTPSNLRGNAAEVVFDFARPITFSVIRLRERIRLGQRIDSVAVDHWNAGTWEPLATATSIGPRRLIRLEKPAETNRLRLRVTQASASPALTEIAVFAEPVDALR